VDMQGCCLRLIGRKSNVVPWIDDISQYEAVGVAQFNGYTNRPTIVAINLRRARGCIFIERIGTRVMDDDLARPRKPGSWRNPNIAAPDLECAIDFPIRIRTEVAGFGEAEFHCFGSDNDG